VLKERYANNSMCYDYIEYFKEEDFAIFMLCIDKFAMILIFLQISDSYDVLSQSMYIDLLPIPPEHTRV